MEYVRKIAHIVAEPEALSWPQLSPFKADWHRLRDRKIVAGSRFEPAHAAFDVLRTKVLRLLRENNWRSVAITSPTGSCGKSLVALNLAFSVARVADRRAAVLDLDLRRPSMRRYLQIEESLRMEQFLRGTATVAETFLNWENSLAIGATEREVADPAELLQNPSTGAAIERLHEELAPDVVIYDMPPLFDNGDVLTFGANVDCALIVAAAGASRVSEIEACERELAKVTNVLGIVLNKCRYMPHRSYY